MTEIGANRQRYAEAHADTDPRPSRFINTDAYAEWATRADAWAKREGLVSAPRKRRTRPTLPASRPMVRVSADTWRAA